MTTKSMVTATEFSNKRGELLDNARAGIDIIIRRNNRIAAVMISKDRYEKLEALEALFDETYLNNQANLAKKKMLSRDEADALTLKLKKATKE
jgi:prevent-host-death family protein